MKKNHANGAAASQAATTTTTNPTITSRRTSNHRRPSTYLKVFSLGILSASLFFLLAYKAITIYADQIGEQAGSSPTSNSESRLKQIASYLETNSRGSASPGNWGDWGQSWNRIYSAIKHPMTATPNGGNADFPTALGGIEDTAPLPPGSYHSEWEFCNASNNYCNTGESTLQTTYVAAIDKGTGLIWSNSRGNANWFTANNCQQPSNGVAPQGPFACSANGDPGCKCVKLPVNGFPTKTGCEALPDVVGKSWRLPYQKELMLAYINGAAQYLQGAAANHWSSSTASGNTQNAWYTSLSVGLTVSNGFKTFNYTIRCVLVAQ